MNNFTFLFIIPLLVFTTQVMAREAVHEIDLEVVSLLSLDDAQAVAYSAVMQQQRAVYRSRSPRGWEQQRAFYQQTFARLKPVLTAEQHVRFVGYMDSFLEAIPEQDLLVVK